jgi:tRNA threonylcarbamoyladenosine biosynthesis protein TsaB
VSAESRANIDLARVAKTLNILAIETSTEACSVAFLREDGEVFSEFEITPRGHTRFLPQMLDSVYQQAGTKRDQTQYIAYGSGPGAFTGVRIAAATAQGLAIGFKADLVPVSTLAILAQQCCDEYSVENILCALDARMGETYCARYQKNAQGLVELQEHEQLMKLDALVLPANYCGAGNGFAAAQEAGMVFPQTADIYPDTYPTALALCKLASTAVQQKRSVDISHTTINYIRNQVAEKKSTPDVKF